NLNVIRPADATETAEAWEIALSSTGRPTVLALTRQGLPAVRTEFKNTNLTARGAYVLAEAEGKRHVILIATGSEVHIALEAREKLQADGIGTRVVSMPCQELFLDQDEQYQRKILPPGAARVAVEAAARLGWDRFTHGERAPRAKGAFVGMEGFGASAPAGTLFEEFGITADAVAQAAKDLV
ncbi:MAG: transketolase-like TK C-terminal-containing protein, partial [Shimia sp.]